MFDRKLFIDLNSKIKVTLVLLVSLLFLPGADSEASIIIVAPHQNDAVFGCGGLIYKEVHYKKKDVRIIYVTDGGASPAANGHVSRNKEALAALGHLGVPLENVVFWDLPDGRLMELWAGSEVSGKTGLLKNRLTDMIGNLLSGENIEELYLPHPYDGHSDHTATFLFFNYELSRNKLNGGNGRTKTWCYSVYGVHEKLKPDQEIFISSGRYAKEKAIKEFRSQLSRETIRELVEKLPKRREYFWLNTQRGLDFLGLVEADCLRIGQNMREHGYDVNLGVVLDVSRRNSAAQNPLAGKQRIFSHTPEHVSLLGTAEVKGYVRSGIIPCVKHFPGLGASVADSHSRLPRIESSRDMMDRIDLMPYRDILPSHPAWVMTAHAVYPEIDDLPASLSPVFQTGILRSTLGFRGLIISDELMVMQALNEFLEDGKRTIHGLPVSQAIDRYGLNALKGILAVKAGTDLLLYFTTLHEQNSRDEIVAIRDAICQAVRDRWIIEDRLAESIGRIFEEKIRLYGPEFLGEQAPGVFIDAMSLEEKVAQMMVVDTTGETLFFKKFNCGGVFARKPEVTAEIIASCTIPPFILGQYEGGDRSVPRLKSSIGSPGALGSRYNVLLSDR